MLAFLWFLNFMNRQEFCKFSIPNPQVHSSIVMVRAFLSRVWHIRGNLHIVRIKKKIHPKVRLNDGSAEVSNRCCNKTNKRGLRSHHHCSVDFDHLPTSSPSPPHCGEVTLLLSMCSAVHADLLVLSQLLSEWGLTHPAFGPLFPARASDWRAFCWQLLALLPGQRHLSWVVVDHLFRNAITSALQLCGMSSGAVWKDHVQGYHMGPEIINIWIRTIFSSSSSSSSG